MTLRIAKELLVALRYKLPACIANDDGREDVVIPAEGLQVVE